MPATLGKWEPSLEILIKSMWTRFPMCIAVFCLCWGTDKFLLSCAALLHLDLNDSLDPEKVVMLNCFLCPHSDMLISSAPTIMALLPSSKQDLL